MRPRYEARVATMRHRQQGHRPWVLVRVTHGTDDGVPVEFVRVVASYGDRDDAIAEAEHRNDMQEGLRRIGVAVAVWAGMAAVQQRAVSVVASEPEYPDAESCSSDARADLIAAGFEHPDDVFVMLVQIARGAVTDTKRCILERLSFRAEVRA